MGQRAAGPEPRFLEHPDEPAEAAAVAAACRELVDSGLPAAEIAVLFRINAQSQVYESALADVGVPYVLKGGERFFERPEVREAVLLLRGAAAGRDDGSPLVPAVRDVLASVGWVEHRPPPGGAARDRWQSLSALVDLAVDLVAEQPTLTLAGFVGHLAERANAQHAPTVQGSPWPRCTRPRGWSGTPSSWWGWWTACCPSRSRWPAPTPWRRSAGCSTSRSPGRGSS
ncbi:3'-5' exonuclease [Klenkia terrae]|uniref:3'-5' exonuclease n=1 Tax=Klenkia terrae TaxID=1052259 RepID=UPI00360EFD53